MSLPPTGADYWSVYLEKGLTTRELLSKYDTLEGMVTFLLHLRKPYDTLPRCAELARTHRSIVDPPGKVSSPSDSTSVLLALLYAPLAGQSKEANGAAGKAEELGKETAERTASEGVIVSVICQLAPGSFMGMNHEISSTSFYRDKGATSEYMIYARRFFTDHISLDVIASRDPKSPNSFSSQKGPTYFDRDIHISVDVLMWRCCMALAESHGLRGFRIFPAPHVPSLDVDRYRWELQRRQEQAAPDSAQKEVEGIAPTDCKLLPLAFCAGCGKRLVGKERKKCVCGVAWYCSMGCQKQDWELLHKAECKRFRDFFARQKIAF